MKHLSVLMLYLQVLMDALAKNILVVVQKSGIVHIKQVLLFLLDAVSSSYTETSGSISKNIDEHMVAICRSIFPVSLVKLLLSEIQDKVFVSYPILFSHDKTPFKYSQCILMEDILVTTAIYILYLTSVIVDSVVGLYIQWSTSNSVISLTRGSIFQVILGSLKSPECGAPKF